MLRHRAALYFMCDTSSDYVTLKALKGLYMLRMGIAHPIKLRNPQALKGRYGNQLTVAR